jgi:hypothetical protein
MQGKNAFERNFFALAGRTFVPLAPHSPRLASPLLPVAGLAPPFIVAVLNFADCSLHPEFLKGSFE